MSPLTIVWNSGSGRASEISELRQTLAERSTQWIDLSEISDLGTELGHISAESLATVVAAGGDGTVNAVVNSLMTIDARRRPTMGIVPLGTANDFAGTLCVPESIASAVNLLGQEAAPVDIVRVRGRNLQRYYANIAAGGNCVRVSEAMTDEMKSRWGAFSYIRGAVDVLPNMTSYRINATCDAEVFTQLDSWAVLVANGRTNAGRIEVAPKASPTDGLIDVIFIRDGTIGDMVEIVANNLLGDFLDSDQVIFRQTRSLRLQSDPPMRFTMDGEVIDEEPLHFEVVPGAIHIHINKQL
ncbi:diacylglycerol/lipid kinase family protein [Rubripirellula reticaptiva]|uniref:Diacylglycerol kinase n=1 Tax=Rubripirellula reticaptiva TaxID=2528013 RepID=A0A5C6EUE6_9BACT|nr:diacylglycerol kinase family protein [Rubripirellula reticaptiva]TWU51236.1 Diacylglycerol kinase [Rubripirellula reticaptiva]